MPTLQRSLENLAMRLFYPAFIRLRGIKESAEETVDLSEYELTFEDNFDGDCVDSSKWKPAGSYMRHGGYWSPSQCFTENGKLIIRTEYKENGECGAGWYSGELETEGLFEQTYGYFECRCKLPAAKGLWSAFWMMPQNSLARGIPAESGVEIDIFESPFFYRKNNRIITSNLHYGGYGKGHKLKPLGFFAVNDPYNEFNTYSVEWNKDSYTFYINRKKTATVKGNWISQHNEHLLLSVEVDGDDAVPAPTWSGSITDNLPGTFPYDFVVDYVRAYRRKEK